MNKSIRNCKDYQAVLPDMLLDDGNVPEPTRSSFAVHTAACTPCGSSFRDLQKTFAALDDWSAPEPTPYFDTRLHARLREEQTRQPEGWFERARSFFLFSTGRQFRPAMAGALALVLVASGGSVALREFHAPAPAAASATIQDLRVLDSNAQALQQMDQLLDDSNDDNDTSPST